ncbi:MAG: hypothetical protein EA396_07270 [Anaerolineaceae bacterium]|nr:MAG: hypothetical protein EA396_07270 [Anaerolineaceae bacterium]
MSIRKTRAGIVRRLWLIFLLLWPVYGVVRGADDPPADDPAEPVIASQLTFISTAHRQDGNRVVSGRGDFPAVTQYDVPLAAEPLWVVGAAVGSAEAVWVTVAADGAIQGVYNLDGAYLATEPLPDSLPPAMPPVLITDAMGSYIDFGFPADIASGSHAVRVPERVAYINADGHLVLLNERDAPMALYDTRAVPSARVVINDLGLAAVYTGADAARYAHDVIGVAHLSTSLTVMDMGFGQIIGRVELPAPQVFEGLSPLWADVDGDGQPDLIVTISDAEAGARVAVFHADGEPLAQGPAIGRGERWRHQLAWAAFGVDGEHLLAEVLTPHLGGIVGFFRYDGAGGLERVARLEGFTSHVLDSPNLDMAVAGDFNGDGQAEIVLPSQSLDRIASLALDANGEISERWSLPLDGVLMTNLSAVTLADGRLALAAGVRQADGRAVLRVWAP